MILARRLVVFGLYVLIILAFLYWIGIVEFHWPLKSHLELVANENTVRQMMTLAMTKGGVDHEADIAAAKRRVEALRPQIQSNPGLQEQAREANERGLVYCQTGQWAEAVQAFQAAYEADSTDVEYINNLGYAFMRRGDLQVAESLLFRALIFGPGRSSAWANLGETYAKQGNLQAAVACFANAYRFSRNQDATRQFLQKLTQDSGENVREAARQSLQLQLIEKNSKQAPSRLSGSAVLRPESRSSEKKTVVYPPSQFREEVFKRRQQFRDEAFKRRQQFQEEVLKSR